MAASQGQRIVLEVLGVVAFVATFEAIQQLKDATSPLRIALAEAWERGKAVANYRNHWRGVREQMETELDTILEGRAT